MPLTTPPPSSAPSTTPSPTATPTDHPAVTVLLPAGTYLIAAGAVNIVGATDLTFTGAGAAGTMLWYTRAELGRCFFTHGNTNLTIQDLSSDVQRLPNGQYDLGIAQGTITAINAAARQVTVQAEGGYPLLNRPDIQASPSSGYGKTLWMQTDPARMDLDGAATMTSIAPSADGTTAVITLQGVVPRLHPGERWVIYNSEGALWCDMGYGNAGATTVQNVNYYGAGMGTMGDAGNNTGTFTISNVYSGPPPYQSDRLIASSGGWAMNSENRASILIENSTFLQTWDDVFDVGCDETGTLSQPSPNQVVVQDGNNGDYQAGDAVEFTDDTAPPVGTTYGQSKITAVKRGGGQVLVTLDRPVTLKSPAKDYFTDLTQAGPITAVNDTFNSAAGRHVYFRSGISVTVRGCTIKDNTPLMLAGWDDSEGPSEAHNVVVTGNTFLRSQGCTVQSNGGASQVASGRNVTITGNRFLNCGRYGELDSHPLSVSNVAGATITDNWFDGNGGTNALFQHDAGITVARNTFLHPNWFPRLQYLQHPRRRGSPAGRCQGRRALRQPRLRGRSVCPAHQRVRPPRHRRQRPGRRHPGYGQPPRPRRTELADGPRPGPAGLLHPPGRRRRQAPWRPLEVLLRQRSNSGRLISKTAGAHLRVAGQDTFRPVAPPHIAAAQQCGAVMLRWPPVPDATGYSVGRSSKSGGPYATVASGLAAGPYLDRDVAADTPYYYVVTASDLPVPNSRSNEACAVPDADYVPIALAPAYTVTGLVPPGWDCHGPGLDGRGDAYACRPDRPLRPLGRRPVHARPARPPPNVVSDAGQQVILPGGALQPPADPGRLRRRSRRRVGDVRACDHLCRRVQPDAHAGHDELARPRRTQPGEADAAAYPRQVTLGGARPEQGSATCMRYTLPLDPAKGVAWLTLPATGKFRLLAMDLGGVDRSSLAPGKSLLSGQYLVSSNGQYILTQRADGDLVLYAGRDPQHAGAILWQSGYTHSGGGPYFTVLQSDGNLVTYRGAPATTPRAAGTPCGGRTPTGRA